MHETLGTPAEGLAFDFRRRVCLMAGETAKNIARTDTKSQWYAAMYQARARDALAESVWHERAGLPAAAAVFRRQHDEDMELARTLGLPAAPHATPAAPKSAPAPRARTRVFGSTFGNTR
jgi:hypothetical protein